MRTAVKWRADDCKSSHALPFRTECLSNLLETFLFFSSLLLICTAVGPVLRGSTDNKVQWFPLQHRSLKVPGAPLCWLYNRNHHVIIRRWLSPLDHGFTHSMEPVRACGKSHGIRPLCEALKTDETRRQSGCRVSPLGMAAFSARFSGGVSAPATAVPGGAG